MVVTFANQVCSSKYKSICRIVATYCNYKLQFIIPVPLHGKISRELSLGSEIRIQNDHYGYFTEGDGKRKDGPPHLIGSYAAATVSYV